MAVPRLNLCAHHRERGDRGRVDDHVVVCRRSRRAGGFRFGKRICHKLVRRSGLVPVDMGDLVSPAWRGPAPHLGSRLWA